SEIDDHLKSVASHWLEKCLIKNAVAIKDLRTESKLVIKQVLKAVWRIHQFSEMEMDHIRWDSLADFVIDASDGNLQLPGRVTANISNMKLSFEPTARLSRESS
ncbi:MAG: hypothetical protein AAGA30_14365, partial [Planctomycetota bacterium]